jgi:hypothetical protein
MKILKRVLKWFGILLGMLFIFGILQIGWGIYREPIAKKQAEDFCASIQLGQSIEGIPERAIASGAEAWLAKWSERPAGVRGMHVTYIGMPPFSRHICSITATTEVTGAEYLYLD